MGTKCREILERELQGLHNKQVLVIGNGQMGRLAAEILQEAGAKVQVTLRTYRHGETVIPRGCGTVGYEDRLEALEGADALVSATTSPHYTLTKEQLLTLKTPPKVAVDLAVPRDIDPACGEYLKLFDTAFCHGVHCPAGVGAVFAVAKADENRRKKPPVPTVCGFDREKGGTDRWRYHCLPANCYLAAVWL